VRDGQAIELRAGGRGGSLRRARAGAPLVAHRL